MKMPKFKKPGIFTETFVGVKITFPCNFVNNNLYKKYLIEQRRN